jgi:hypothetical protein
MQEALLPDYTEAYNRNLYFSRFGRKISPPPTNPAGAHKCYSWESDNTTLTEDLYIEQEGFCLGNKTGPTARGMHSVRVTLTLL